MQELAGEKEAEESDGEENYNHLYEEASMPIEKVIEKYTNLVNPTLKNLKKGDKIPRSPVITKKESCSVSKKCQNFLFIILGVLISRLVVLLAQVEKQTAIH